MEKEVNCINTRAILDYVKAFHHGDCAFLFKDLDPEVDTLPNPEVFFRDANNWVSCAVATKMYRKVRETFRDEMAAYKIARHAIENTSLGYTQLIIIKAFWSTRKGLKNLQKINDRWNRNKRVELVDLQGSEAIIRLHWNPKMEVTKDLCLMNQGSYTFMPTIWGGAPFRLEEKCCFFEGAPYCEYHLKWPYKNRWFELFSRLFFSKSVLKETIREMEEGKRIIEEKYEEVNRLNLELNYKIKQLEAIQDTGKAILSVLDLNQLLTVIINILNNVCQINRVLIMLVNEEKGRLEYLHGVGFQGRVPDSVMNYQVPLDRVSNLLVRVTNTGKSEYIPRVEESSLNKENIILIHGRPRSVYVVPLITRSKVIGVMATDSVDGEGIPLKIRETLEVFAPQIAIAIENAKLYSKLQEQMKALKRSSALLARMEKLSFFGNLAARLAHEIKNPMVAIRTFLQMLPRKYEDQEFREGFYQVALEETNRVNNLITELLDLVKIRESRFEQGDLNGLIEKMLLLVTPQFLEKRIRIERHLSPEIGMVWMDEEKMKQVILNILYNAMEFTPEKGQVNIDTFESLSSGGTKTIGIRISDTGPGISQANINQIFDPYFTTKLKSSLHNGTGLGLYVAHQNMLDHRGNIEVESREGIGTQFTLTLPVHPVL
jgi:signal transduction histidine kinase/predicted nucleic-acid-binding protein